MSLLADHGIKKRFLVAAAIFMILMLVSEFELMPRDMVVSMERLKFNANSAADAEQIRIKDKVAVISDTQYTPKLVPLILHFHAVLGPEWPIVFYTSEETSNRLIEGAGYSAVWKRAVESGAIDMRTIPDEFDITSRIGVNVYLSRPWLWQQLAPAKHVLIFQTDAMICGNSHRTVDDFLEWDFIGAPMHTTRKFFNGGLSLRNRTMLLDILNDPTNNWERETADGSWTLGGEDIWFSWKMQQIDARLCDFNTAVTFACQHDWHISHSKEPLGYHKVHKVASDYLPEIAEWCPEIGLAAAGLLKPQE